MVVPSRCDGPATSHAGTPPGDPTTQFAGQLNHFTSAIRDGTPILTGGDMGLRDARLIEAIYAAARDGRTVKLVPDGRMQG